jgi:hypothetical protein
MHRVVVVGSLDDQHGLAHAIASAIRLSLACENLPPLQNNEVALLNAQGPWTLL